MKITTNQLFIVYAGGLGKHFQFMNYLLHPVHIVSLQQRVSRMKCYQMLATTDLFCICGNEVFIIFGGSKQYILNGS